MYMSITLKNQNMIKILIWFIVFIKSKVLVAVTLNHDECIQWSTNGRGFSELFNLSPGESILKNGRTSKTLTHKDSS